MNIERSSIIIVRPKCLADVNHLAKRTILARFFLFDASNIPSTVKYVGLYLVKHVVCKTIKHCVHL